MSELKRLLLLPRIKVHNANALSSPFTIGFPAMTAWLGAVHALQRKLNANGFSEVKFNGTAVINHHCDLQTHQGIGDFVYSIIGTGNPLDKTGARSAFIEEARCHLDVSLVIEYTDIEKDDEVELTDKITHLLNSQMKMAGGDILSFAKPEFFKVETGDHDDLRKITRKLMPGYALIERRDLMIEAMEQGQDAIDALLDHLTVHHRCNKDIFPSGEEKITWTSKRKTQGWLVPIATGFHGLTELGEAKNQRDPNTPHRFAESLVTLGEFKMPHNIKSIDEMLWHYQVQADKNLYLCKQKENSTTNAEAVLANLFNNI